MSSNRESKLAQMRLHIEQCRDSGMSVEKYCEQAGIKYGAYYYYHKILFGTVRAQHGGASFVKVQPSNSSGVITVVGSNGVSVSFSTMVPAQYVKELLQ